MVQGAQRAIDQFQAGRLEEAIRAAVEEVRQRPTDLAARWVFCELLCLAGDLERADKQLDLLVTQDPSALAGISLFRQLIRAETARRQVFTEGRPPELFTEPSPDVPMRLKALLAQREGRSADVIALLDEAESVRPHTTGSITDGGVFDDFRDLDDLTAGVLEVHTPTGKYAWVPLNAIATLEPRKPTRLRDLMWKPARLAVKGGQDGEIYLPALYHGTHHSADDRLRLGRLTDWVGRPVRGMGLKCFLVGEKSVPIAELQPMTFAS